MQRKIVNGKVVYEITGDQSNQELVLSTIESALGNKINEFFDFVEQKTKKKSNRILGEGADPIPEQVFQDWKDLEKKNPDKKIGGTFRSDKQGVYNLSFTIDDITKFYNDKGNYYIEIGNKGLFFLGKDQTKNIFGAPNLDNQGIIQVKLTVKFSKTTATLDGNVKPRIRVSFGINTSNKVLKPSPLSITNQETLNKSYDEMAAEKSTANMSKSKKKETKTEQEGEDIEGTFKFFVPPSAEDFMGLIYSFLGKGELGERQKQFFEAYLNAPYKRGVAALETAKQRLHEGYRLVRKNNPEARKKLGKKVPGQPFTYDQAIRVYIWNKQGTDLSEIGLNEKEIAELAKIIEDFERVDELKQKIITYETMMLLAGSLTLSSSIDAGEHIIHYD